MRVKQLGAYTNPTLFAALVAISGLVDGAKGPIVLFAFLAVMYWFQQRWALWVGLIASLYMISFHATCYSLSDVELEHLKLGKHSLGQTARAIFGYVLVGITLVSTLLLTRKSKALD